MADRFCDDCKVEVSSDLANCPLCGKYLLKKGEQVEENKYSFPLYNFKYIQKEKALKLIRNLLVLAGAICLFVNLIFWTKPLWFPYALVSLFCLYMMWVHPLRQGGTYLKAMPMSTFYLALLLIFIDAYDYLVAGTKFGWAFAQAVPWIVSAVALTCAIFALTKNKLNISLAKRVMYIAILSIAYFIIKITIFKSLPTYPSLTMVCVSVGLWVMLIMIKPKLIVKSMQKDFHI